MRQNLKVSVNHFIKGDFDNEKLAQSALDKMNLEGYCLIHNFIPNTSSILESSNAFIRFINKIGDPVSHDSNNSIIWDISPNKTLNDGIITYSEHSHEAELHTDSQYSRYPEEYFGLLTLRKACCGGGESYLLSLNDILRELGELPNGTKTEEILKSSEYPFIVPNVFKQTQGEKEYNFGPILGLNEIRFRVDTLEKALKEKPDSCTKEQAQAYYQLKNIIINSPSIKRFFLEDGDLLLVNNKTMLHGRSQFSDPNRHLLRIRFNTRRVI